MRRRSVRNGRLWLVRRCRALRQTHSATVPVDSMRSLGCCAMQPAPRSIKRLAILLPAAALTGAVELAVGGIEVAHLSANKSGAFAATPAANEVHDAIRNLETSTL